MARRQFVKKEHFDRLVLVEPKPIKLAKVPAEGKPLHECILLDPRYVTQYIDHKIIEVEGYVRGRTIEVLLDEPTWINGSGKCAVFSFKGIGADADVQLAINPNLWYSVNKIWTNDKDTLGRLGRVWGAVRNTEGKEEFKNEIFRKEHVAEVKQVALNYVPESVQAHIENLTGEKFDSGLCQIVRGLKTNVRYTDLFQLSPEEKEKYLNAREIAHTDINLMKAQRNLFECGLIYVAQGLVRNNRLMNGDFIDAENYDLIESSLFDILKHRPVIWQAIESSYTALKSIGKADEYIQLLRDNLGNDFSENFIIDPKKPKDLAVRSALMNAVESYVLPCGSLYITKDMLGY